MKLWKIVLVLIFVLGFLVMRSCERNHLSIPDNINRSGVIVAFGDSLTFGHGVEKEDNYPTQLERMLHVRGYDHYVVKNYGVDGDTTRDGVQRLDEVWKETPEIVILVLGANDAFQGVPAAEVEQNLRQMIRAIQPHGSLVLLAGVKPTPTKGLVYMSEFETLYENLSQEFGLSLMPSFLSGVMLRAQYNIADGIHPNRAGYSIIVNNLWPYLEPLLLKP